ncbi:MAG: hypothetical protein QMD71_09360 [bacterium]|nr:hypothetical protein [bacterium]
MKNVLIILFIFTGCAQLHKYKPIPWAVGQWVSYEVNGEPLKVSIVGKDLAGFWLETVEPEVVVKFLVEEGGTQPNKLIVKTVGDSPIEFPVDKFNVKSILLSAKIDESANLRNEILTLTCGKLRVFHTTYEGSDIWLSSKVPIFGIVKYMGKDKLIVLRDYGIKGAESEIKEQAESANFIVE